jgi:hypothetical protein
MLPTPSFLLEPDKIKQQIKETNAGILSEYNCNGFLGFIVEEKLYKIYSEILAYALYTPYLSLYDKQLSKYREVTHNERHLFLKAFAGGLEEGSKLFRSKYDRPLIDTYTQVQQDDFFKKLVRSIDKYKIAKENYPLILNENESNRYGFATGFIVQLENFISENIEIVKRFDKKNKTTFNQITLKSIFRDSKDYDLVIKLLEKEKLIIRNESTFIWNGYKDNPLKEALYDCAELKSIHALGINLKLKNYLKSNIKNAQIAKALSNLFNIKIVQSSYNRVHNELKEDSNSLYNRLFQFIATK